MRAYFNFIGDGNYNAAYALLDPLIQDSENFERPKWDEYLDGNIFKLPDELIVDPGKYPYHMEFELIITPKNSFPRVQTWTFCVAHYPENTNEWVINGIWAEPHNCPES